MNWKREQDLQRFSGHHPGGGHFGSEDEYAGLMTQRERQWVINIQLNQAWLLTQYPALHILTMIEKCILVWFVPSIGFSLVLEPALEPVYESWGQSRPWKGAIGQKKPFTGVATLSWGNRLKERKRQVSSLQIRGH